MIHSAINLENHVRRRFNRRVLFCIRIKGAALGIGLWDLFIHSIALCALIFMFGHAPQTITHLNEPFNPSFSSSSNLMLNNKHFHSSSILLARILDKRNVSHPPMKITARNFYSHLNFMTIKRTQSLSQQDKCIVFFIIFSATILIAAHICGVVTNKASYIVPYFLIKVFNVIVSIISMLAFYTYLPDITVWLRMQPEFPLQNYLLELDTQTLQLVIFTFLLFVILAKLYIAAIIWYCYGYITALTMARTIGMVTPDALQSEMYSPPKYAEAIKSNPQDQEDCAPPPYTPLLSS